MGMAGMRIVDENGNEIANPDLSAGTLSPTIVVRKGAVPPDDVEKFAWADDDYEEVAVYVERAGAPGILANGSASIEDLMVAVAELGALVAGE
ncbi:hypothetical protein C1879_01135 [Paraeggerthella hongkongensis]|nr:hypothetical protein C1879_01135 [Paraeggerthella hongkongensis]